MSQKAKKVKFHSFYLSSTSRRVLSEIEQRPNKRKFMPKKLPILLESDGKLLIDCTADGNCVLYPKLLRDGHD